MGYSHIWTRGVIKDIHVKSDIGRYRMRGFLLHKLDRDGTLLRRELERERIELDA